MINLQISKSLIPPSAPPKHADLGFLKTAAQEALRLAGAPPDGELSLVLTDDAQLQLLNHQYLGIDAPTDVLSFPSGELDPESGHTYLGDILISYPTAAVQAQAGGHSIQDELRLLLVHGVLHLLGYDHAGPDEKARMWEMQGRILEQLGASIRGPAG